jgi:Flp pilus assembly protein TadD
MHRLVIFVAIATCLVSLAARAAGIAADGRREPRVALKPEYSPADLGLLHEVSGEAETLVREGRKEEYLELLERTAERAESPRLRRSLFDSLGFAYTEAGRNEKAEEAYRSSIGIPGP